MYVSDLLLLFPSTTYCTIQKAIGSRNGKIEYRVLEEGKIYELYECMVDDVKSVTASGKNDITITVF